MDFSPSYPFYTVWRNCFAKYFSKIDLAMSQNPLQQESPGRSEAWHTHPTFVWLSVRAPPLPTSQFPLLCSLLARAPPWPPRPPRRRGGRHLRGSCRSWSSSSYAASPRQPRYGRRGCWGRWWLVGAGSAAGYSSSRSTSPTTTAPWSSAGSAGCSSPLGSTTRAPRPRWPGHWGFVVLCFAGSGRGGGGTGTGDSRGSEVGVVPCGRRLDRWNGSSPIFCSRRWFS